MKKKFIILGILTILILICINLLYGFFYEDNIKNVVDKFIFRNKYYSREIMDKQMLYGDFENNNILTKNNISIQLSNISYDQPSGKLNAIFEVSANDNQSLDKICFLLKVNDNKNIFYNKRVGEKLFVDNLDYLLYNNDLYYKLSTKNLDTSSLEKQNPIGTSQKDDQTKNVEMTLYLGENYEISDDLYIEFLNLIYKPTSSNSHKVFDGYGSFRFVINF